MRENKYLALALLIAVSSVFTQCKDKKAEDRIKALESSPSANTAAPDAAQGPFAKMEFTTTEHDFGTINQGDIVEHTYSFKNTGEVPLVIQSARGSCGCTVPDWSKEPVPVGGEGFIKAKFDSQGKVDHQTKTVTVTANTYPPQTDVRFTADVKVPEAKK